MKLKSQPEMFWIKRRCSMVATNCVWMLLVLNVATVVRSAATNHRLIHANEPIDLSSQSLPANTPGHMLADSDGPRVKLQKRAALSERDYNFGIGKREGELNRDVFERNFNDNEPAPNSAPEVNANALHSQQILAQLTQMLDEQQKRTDQLNRYAFGLGKREQADRYAFGLGKRGNDAVGPYQFGLGKRAIPDGRFEFGIGKRDPMETRYNFGLGKRAVDTLNYRVSRQKLGDNERFAFGLGKRDAVDRKFEDFIKRRFSFGIGKRADEDRFAFGLGK